VITRQT